MANLEVSDASVGAREPKEEPGLVPEACLSLFQVIESAMENGRLQLHGCGGALKLLRHIGNAGVRQRLNLLHTRIRRMTRADTITRDPRPLPKPQQQSAMLSCAA